jgi:hypothetical protein
VPNEFYVSMQHLTIDLFEYKLVQVNYSELMEMILSDSNQMVLNQLFDDNFENILMDVLHAIYDLIHLNTDSYLFE